MKKWKFRGLLFSANRFTPDVSSLVPTFFYFFDCYWKPFGNRLEIKFFLKKITVATGYNKLPNSWGGVLESIHMLYFIVFPTFHLFILSSWESEICFINPYIMVFPTRWVFPPLVIVPFEILRRHYGFPPPPCYCPFGNKGGGTLGYGLIPRTNINLNLYR